MEPSELERNNVDEDTNLEIIQITNPNWLGYLGPHIKTFIERTNLPTMTYETLYTYFSQSVQNPAVPSEFWVVKKGEEIVAFAHWYVCGLPHRGVVFCDFIHSWNRMREPVQMLFDEFIKFGQKNRCVIYKGTALNEAVFRVFRKAASKRKYNFEKTSLIDCLGRKVNE